MKFIDELNVGSGDFSISMSIYLLGFSSYNDSNQLRDTGYE